MSAIRRLEELRAVLAHALRHDAPAVPWLETELAAVELAARAEMARELSGSAATRHGGRDVAAS